MTQYVINIGAIPNDGTGDPLRTAFNETNLNFDQVFAAGPVLSNVRIANNTILTTTTNGNLILAPNGIGRIQANATIVPSVTNVRDLGSADQRWSTLYVQYANISGSLSLTNLTATGNVTVGGNLTVTGNIINVANIVTDAKTIQLSNTAASANAANGSGITVGANDNIATFLYDSSFDAWVTENGLRTTANVNSGNLRTTGLISATGNISANNISANSNLSANNISANGNLSANNVFVTNDVYSKRGTFTGDPVTGDASLYIGSPTFTNLGTDVMAQFTGNVPAYAQLNLQNYSDGNTASGDYIITADNGTDSTHFLNLGLTGSNWDGTQPNSLGNRLGPNDGYLYVQDGDMVIGTSNGNIETWKFGQDGTLTAPGNITANYFLGNIEGLIGNITNLDSVNFAVENIGALIGNNGVNIGAGGNNNLVVLPDEVLIQNVPLTVDTLIVNQIRSNDSSFVTVEDGLNVNGDVTADTVTTTGNITGNYFIGNGSQLTGLSTNSISNGNSNVEIVTANGNVSITASGTETWNFGTDGRLTFPGTPRIDTDANNFEVQAAESINFEANAVVNIYTDTSGTTKQWQFGDSGDLSVPGDVQFADGSFITDNLEATGNFGISTAANVGFMIDTNEAAHTWTFDATGNLNLPNGGSIIVDGGDGVIGPVSDDMVISWDNEEIRMVSVAGSIEMQADNAFRVQTNYDSGSDTYLSRWEFNQDEIVNITGPADIVTEAGDLTLSGGRNGIASGNVTIQAVNNGAGVRSFDFGNDGNLTLPLSGNLVGATPNNNGYLSWFGNSSGDGNGYTTMRLVPDDTREGSDQYLIIDPTAPGHIHIRAGGTQDNSGADLFLGGENSYFRVNAGANSQTQITSNSNTWVFNTDGNLQVPGSINGDNNGPLLIDGNGSGTEGYISLPASNFGGEQIAIVNQFSLGNGIALTTNGGEWHFDNSGNLTVPGNIVMPPGSSLVGNGASPAPSISGFSNGEFGGNVSVTGNITGGNLSVTGNITGNTAGYAIGYRDIPQVSFTGNATIATTDAGKHFYSTQSSNYTLTIANNASQGFQVGAAITVVNQGTGTITIAQGSDVTLYLAGNATPGNRSVATFGMATIMKVATNTWFINGTGVS